MVRLHQRSVIRHITKALNMQTEHAGCGYENVDYGQRIFFALLGAGLVLRGLRSGVMGGLTGVMGIALLSRAASGYCPAYHAMEIITHVLFLSK